MSKEANYVVIYLKCWGRNSEGQQLKKKKKEQGMMGEKMNENQTRMRKFNIRLYLSVYKAAQPPGHLTMRRIKEKEICCLGGWAGGDGPSETPCRAWKSDRAGLDDQSASVTRHLIHHDHSFTTTGLRFFYIN